MMDEHQTSGAAEVVVGTDGIEAAARAVAWAASEARLCGVPLRMVHATHYAMAENSPDSAGSQRSSDARRPWRISTSHASQHIPNKSASNQYAPSWTLPAIVRLLVIGMRWEQPIEVVIGSVALAVSGAARCPVTVVRGQRHAADSATPVVFGREDVAIDAPAVTTAHVVVVGTHGRGAPARLLLGFTSRAVVRYSPCPVMVVRWDTVVREVAPNVASAPAVSAAQAGAGSLPHVVSLPDRGR